MMGRTSPNGFVGRSPLRTGIELGVMVAAAERLICGEKGGNLWMVKNNKGGNLK